MSLQIDGTTPIYIQIAEWLENRIISGSFKAGDKVYSQYKLADMFNINPATAAKGLNLLTDEKILYTKRGLGKFVTKEAREIIVTKRKSHKLQDLVRELVLEARRLNVGEEELIHMIKTINASGKGE